MEEKIKKPSLFKQRISMIRGQDNNQGFPQAVNVVSYKKISEVKEEKQQKIQVLTQQKVQTKGLIDLIKSQSVLKEEDMKIIQSENWAKIEAMSEEERLSMINSINKQMKESFISRIKKQPPSEAKTTIPQEPKPQSHKKPQNQAKQDDELWQMMLKIDIETNILMYTEQNRENLITIGQIIEMISSENNQSQIISSKITAKLIEQLHSLTTSKTRELIIVNHVPLHISIIFESLSFLLIQPLLKRAKNTAFGSAFVEITTKLAEILTKINKYLSKQTKSQFHKLLINLLDKSNSFNIEKQNLIIIKSSIQLLCKAYDHHENKLEHQDLVDLKNNSDILLEIILLEQADTTFINTYASNILQFILISADLDEIILVLNFTYEIINKLILRKNRQLYINIQSFRNHWIIIIENLLLRLIPKIVNNELQSIFQLIFLARFAGGVCWQSIILNLPQLSQIKPMISHFVLFNTLSDQKAGLSQENLQSLNSVFNWLANCLTSTHCKVNPNYLLNVVAELFLQQQEYYSELDQQILLKFITSISMHKSTKLSLVFTQEKIRTLITNYGFNSFGNIAFTNLLLLISINSSIQLQAMVVREAMLRYSGNFLRAAKELNVNMKDMVAGRLKRNEDIKNEVIELLREDDRSQENAFVIYLKY